MADEQHKKPSPQLMGILADNIRALNDPRPPQIPVVWTEQESNDYPQATHDPECTKYSNRTLAKEVRNHDSAHQNYKKTAKFSYCILRSFNLLKSVLSLSYGNYTLGENN